MKNTKKIIAMFLVICMVISALPVMATASSTLFALYITDTIGGSSKSIDISANDSGAGWSWDASSEVLTLSGFNGQYIEANGTLHIVINGTNRITGADEATAMISASNVYIDKTSSDVTDTLTFVWEHNTDNNRESAIDASYIYLLGGTYNFDLTNTELGDICASFGYTEVHNGTNINADIYAKKYSARFTNNELLADGYGNITINSIAGDTAGNLYAYSASSLDFDDYQGTAIINSSRHDSEKDAYAVYSLHGNQLALGETGHVELHSSTCVALNNYYLSFLPKNIKTTPSQVACDVSTNSLYNIESNQKVKDLVLEYSSTEQPMVVDTNGLEIPSEEVGTDVNIQLSKCLTRVLTPSYEIISGTLPQGLTLESPYGISGTLEDVCPAGSVTIRVTDLNRTVNNTFDFVLPYGEVYRSTKYISINGNNYDNELNASGTGWTWDAATSTLTLNNFTGTDIYNNGPINLVLNGTNTITGINDSKYIIKANGDIVIDKTTSDTTDILNLIWTGNTDGDREYAIANDDGDTIINGGTVNFNLTNVDLGDICCVKSYLYVNNGANINANVYAEKYSARLTYGDLYAAGSGNINITTCTGDRTDSTNSFALATPRLSGFSGNLVMNCTRHDSDRFAYDFNSVGYESFALAEGGRVELHATTAIAVSSCFNITNLPKNVKTTPEVGYEQNSRYIYDYTHDKVATDLIIEYTDEEQPMRCYADGIATPDVSIGDEIRLNLDNYTMYVKSGRYEIIDGTLPDGISMDEYGNFSGYATTPALASEITVRITDISRPEGSNTIDVTLTIGRVRGYAPVTGIEIAKTEIIISEYTSKTLTANVLPADANNTDVTWSSSNPSVASVGINTGKVYGNEPGTCTITATSKEGGYKATCTVYVTESTPKADISADGVVRNLYPNRTYSINGKIYKSNSDGQITLTEWPVSRVSIVLVSTTGIGKCNSSAQIIYPYYDAGDIDNNGTVDTNDYSMISSYVLCQRSLNPLQKQAADLNGDGVVDGFDAILLDCYLNGVCDINGNYYYYYY